MDKYLFYLVVIVMMSFFACKEDIQNYLVIEATNVENSRSDIVTVKAIIENIKNLPDGEWYTGEDIIASAKYKKSGFKLYLPDTIPNEYLSFVSNCIGISEGTTISDTLAKMAFVDINAYNREGKKIGSFSLKRDTCCIPYVDIVNGVFVDSLKIDTFVAYFEFADRDFTINTIFENGTERVISYKKGWNISLLCGRTIKITTYEELNEDFKWYYKY